MTSKNAANLETPQKQATSTSAAMRIPTCESHCLPTYRGANSTSLSPLQPTENNHYVSSGVDLGSPLTTFSQNVENAQNKHIYDFTIAQNSPYPSRHERFDNIFILPDDPFTLTPPDISRDLRTFSSPAFVAETAANGALHMHAASESAFEVNDPLTQADRFDTTLQDFDSTMFGMPDLVAPNVDYQPISLDNWTTPNTLVEAITPKLPAQSSWPIVRYDDLIGVPNSTIDALEELQLDFDFNFQDFEPDFISSGHVNPDLELPSYPPVPDTSPQLDGGGLDQPEMPSPYHVLPPVPCMNEEVPAAWMGLDMSQSLCPADVVNTIHTIPTPEMSSGTRSRPPGAKSAQRDTSKDDFLVRCKERGMSYKQIKILGHFEEAESTLRGRYRALTKPREARLRKPEWGNQEVSIRRSLQIQNADVGNARYDCSSMEWQHVPNPQPWS